jgi:hypothetical protein
MIKTGGGDSGSHRFCCRATEMAKAAARPKIRILASSAGVTGALTHLSIDRFPREAAGADDAA